MGAVPEGFPPGDSGKLGGFGNHTQLPVITWRK